MHFTLTSHHHAHHQHRHARALIIRERSRDGEVLLSPARRGTNAQITWIDLRVSVVPGIDWL